MDSKGLLLVISGPSGTGKGTLIKPLRKSNENIMYSVSVTTREPRKEDVEGKTYFFTDKDSFESMIENDELLEWDKYCNNYYGTPKKYIEDWINDGHDVILEITVPGALEVKKRWKDCVMIFISPPSFEELKSRILKRTASDPQTEDDIKRRLEKARWECEQLSNYDYVVVNDDIDKALYELRSIITAEKLKSERFSLKIK